MMFGALGVAGGTMTIIRDELVDRMGGNSPPDSPKSKVDKRAFRTAGAKGPPAPSRWIRSLDSYDRQQPREYAVTRFG
jgi:hypothetical protein